MVIHKYPPKSDTVYQNIESFMDTQNCAVFGL